MVGVAVEDPDPEPTLASMRFAGTPRAHINPWRGVLSDSSVTRVSFNSFKALSALKSLLSDLSRASRKDLRNRAEASMAFAFSASAEAVAAARAARAEDSAEAARSKAASRASLEGPAGGGGGGGGGKAGMPGKGLYVGGGRESMSTPHLSPQEDTRRFTSTACPLNRPAADVKVREMERSTGDPPFNPEDMVFKSSPTEAMSAATKAMSVVRRRGELLEKERERGELVLLPPPPPPLPPEPLLWLALVVVVGLEGE